MKLSESLYRRKSLLSPDEDSGSIFHSILFTCRICGESRRLKVKEVLRNPHCPKCDLVKPMREFLFLLIGAGVDFVLNKSFEGVDGEGNPVSLVCSVYLPTYQIYVDFSKIEQTERIISKISDASPTKSDVVQKIESEIKLKETESVRLGLTFYQVERLTEGFLGELKRLGVPL